MDRLRGLLAGKMAKAAAAGLALVAGMLLITTILLTSAHPVLRSTSSGPSCASKFSVSPASGAAGTPLSLRGAAWPANKTLGIYFVDPSHHIRSDTLQTLTIPPGGSWTASAIVPATVTFHAVGDQTLSSDGSAQDVNQAVVPGQYLIYAAVDDVPDFSIQSVCPVKFTIPASAGALGVGAGPAAETGSSTHAATYVARSNSTTPRMTGLLGLGVVFIGAVGGLLLLGRRARSSSAGQAFGPLAERQFVALKLGLLLLAILVALLPGVTGAWAAGRSATITLFSDTFESDAQGKAPAGWTTNGGNSWSVQMNGSHVLAQTSANTNKLYDSYAGSISWTDYSLSASVMPGAGSTTVNTSVVAIDGRRQDANNFYSLLIKNGNVWYLGKKISGNWWTLATGTFAYNPSSWYTFTLTMMGTTISAGINGATLATVTDGTFVAGNIGLTTRNQSQYDNVVVTGPGNPLPLPSPTPPAPPMLIGQVTDVATGAPIAGAQVSTVPGSVTTTTANNGSYAFWSLLPKTYAVVVAAKGYNANYVAGVMVKKGTTASANLALQPVPAYTAMDLYTQLDQIGWNPSTDGNTWLDDAKLYRGAAVSIQSNTGYVDTYTAATDRDEWINVQYAGQLVSADFNVSAFGQDAYQHGARLLGRIYDAHHYIDFAVNYASNTLQIWSNVNESWTMLSQVRVPPFTAHQWYHAKLLSAGNESYAKVWAFGTPEPGWQISGNQPWLTSGGGGLRSTYADINWTNFSVQGVTTISGLVRTSSGTPIAGAMVTDSRGDAATTDSHGRYVLIEPNATAAYMVTASAPGYSNVSTTVATTKLQLSGQNFTL